MRTKYGMLCCAMLLISVLAFSCREEESEFIQAPPEESLESNSEVAALLQNTSMKDGSFDNIIDSASCISVMLPVVVQVNGLEIIVDSQEDFQAIEDIFEEFDDDDDRLSIEFPITIVLNDFTEVEVNNTMEFKDFADECGEDNVDDDDIECIDIEYPVTASIFNLSNELINSITLSNDRDLYHFIEDLSEEVIVNVSFPITVFLSDSTELEVFDLDELEELIESAKDDCDEDDDNDFNDDDCDNCTPNQLSEVLQSCPSWQVDKLERDQQDLEDIYQNYSFGFLQDGQLEVFNGSDTLSGEWDSDGNANNISVLITIPGLGDFSDTWRLHEIQSDDDEQKVDLRIGDDRLRFESDCFDDNGPGNQDLGNVLIDSTWLVASYVDSGDDETSDFEGYRFDFIDDGTIVVTNGSSSTGTWSVRDSGSELVLDFGTNSPLDELNDEWDVISFNNDRVELQDISGGGGGTDTLIFEKQ